jgi:hypothetical protein
MAAFMRELHSIGDSTGLTSVTDRGQLHPLSVSLSSLPRALSNLQSIKNLIQKYSALVQMQNVPEEILSRHLVCPQMRLFG